MCLAKLYQNGGSEELILDNIAYMKLDGQRVELETLFGESKTLHGKVRQVDFVKSRVIFESEP